MKRNHIIISFFLGLMIFFFTGCGEPVEKKIVGTWLIEDITISGDTSMFNYEQFRKTINEQKQLKFELKSDSSIAIHTGISDVNGFWRYDKKTRQVFVTFEGNRQATPLGIYKDGKLINSDTNTIGTVFNTIFYKEVLKEEKP